nr:immunoglobulin light chain junction region [Macaca mulatta]
DYYCEAWDDSLSGPDLF